MRQILQCLNRVKRAASQLLAWPVLVLAAWPDTASAYPERPVRMIVGAAAGGSNDLVARLPAEGLTARLPHPVVVENRSGAAGMIGLETVARAAPDGHTLLLVNTVRAIATIGPHWMAALPEVPTMGFETVA